MKSAHWRIKIFVAVLCVFSHALFVNAQEANIKTAQNPGDKIYTLSLNESMTLALQNNFEIQLAKYDVLIAKTNEGVAESIYDTVINAQIQYKNDQLKAATSFAGEKTLTNEYNLSLTKKLPTGMTVTAGLENTRTWSDSSFSTQNPSHDVTASFQMKQELGKNFFGLQDRGNVKITQIDVENVRIYSLDKIETHLAHVQKAYWDLVLQIEKSRIVEDMVDQAKKLFDLNTEKLADGLTEKPEVLASEANYKNRVNQLILAKNQIATMENILKLLINIDNDVIRIEPTDKFMLTNGAPELDKSLKKAFQQRKDYQQLKNVIDLRKIRLSMKKQNLWPEINLEATLARNGLDDHFPHAYNKLGEEDNSYFSAGVSISIPFENTLAESEYDAAKLEKARAVLNMKYIERIITIDIIDQVQLCHVLKTVAVNGEDIALLQAEKLKEEEKRFNRGRSDTDTIIRFQDDTSQARIEAAEAKFQYYISKIDLFKKEGTLLHQYWDGKI
ncbi:MAG: TolC family protein [Candidatus Omnitrophica bacterium]|nr:TolC family protein [Candidatus Omnitrophota bacterium]